MPSNAVASRSKRIPPWGFCGRAIWIRSSPAIGVRALANRTARATLMASFVISTPACAQAPSPVLRQVEAGIDLCLRFVRRELDDSLQYYGDKAGFRPTSSFRVQRWEDPIVPTLWVELQADGAQMKCDVRASPSTFASAQAAIDFLSNQYEPEGYSSSNLQPESSSTSWRHDTEEGLLILTVSADAYLIATLP